MLYFCVSYPAGVDANDILYGSDPAFIADCNGLASSVLSAAIKSVQVNTATAVCPVIIYCIEFTQPLTMSAITPPSFSEKFHSVTYNTSGHGGRPEVRGLLRPLPDRLVLR